MKDIDTACQVFFDLRYTQWCKQYAAGRVSAKDPSQKRLRPREYKLECYLSIKSDMLYILLYEWSHTGLAKGPRRCWYAETVHALV